MCNTHSIGGQQKAAAEAVHTYTHTHTLEYIQEVLLCVCVCDVCIYVCVCGVSVCTYIHEYIGGEHRAAAEEVLALRQRQHSSRPLL